MEPTVIIALITALAAIVSPLITAIINNHNTLRIKEFEAKEERLRDINLHERAILENALAGLGIIMSWKDKDSIKEASKNVLMSVAYVDSDTGEQLKDLVYSIMNSNKEATSNEYSKICAALKNEIVKRTVQ